MRVAGAYAAAQQKTLDLRLSRPYTGFVRCSKCGPATGRKHGNTELRPVDPRHLRQPRAPRS